MDNREALKRIYETEDKLKKWLALLASSRKVIGKKYWEEQGLKSYPDFDARLRASVFAK